MTIPKTWVGSGLPSLPFSYAHVNLLAYYQTDLSCLL